MNLCEWISIKEKLPEKGEGVLVTDGVIVTSASLDYLDYKPFWWDGYGFSGHEWDFDFSSKFDDGEITHWMPHPALPAFWED